MSFAALLHAIFFSFRGTSPQPAAHMQDHERGGGNEQELAREEQEQGSLFGWEASTTAAGCCIDRHRSFRQLGEGKQNELATSALHTHTHTS